MLGVSQVVPLPQEHEVAPTALPSERFPSDHLSLCCDLHWLPATLDHPDGLEMHASSTPDGKHASSTHHMHASSTQPVPKEHGTQQGGAGGGVGGRRGGAAEGLAARYPGRLKDRIRLPHPASGHLIHKAVCALQAGMLVAVPTDTVYGLCAAADNAQGVARLFEVQPPSPAPLLHLFSPPFWPPKRDKAGWHWRGRAAAWRTTLKLLRVMRIGPMAVKQIQIYIRCI